MKKAIKKGLAVILAMAMAAMLLPMTAVLADTAVSEGAVIHLSDPDPAASGEGWSYQDQVYTIEADATVTVTGDNQQPEASNRRIVADGTGISITLDNVSVTGLDANQSAMYLNNGSNVTVTLVGTNILTGGVSGIGDSQGSAGIRNTESTVRINGTGSLTATGSGGGAGIGGGASNNTNSNNQAGTLVIDSGTVTANGGSNAAGIGGAQGTSMTGPVTINGGIVNANGGNGAGIGGGRNATQGATVTINGGIVTATTQDDSNAAIGGGASRGGGNVNIHGGIVIAIGGAEAAGIGAGRYSSGGQISGGSLYMNGNAVVFTSSLSNNAGSEKNTDGVVRGVLFVADQGTVYGDVKLASDLNISDTQTLNIPEQASLTVGSGITLDNEGEITGQGKITITGTGEIIGAGTIAYSITLNDFGNVAPTGIMDISKTMQLMLAFILISIMLWGYILIRKTTKRKAI
ncbi:MAG: hypothetical protein FWH14_05820 [Oscillospiraceae bacterium]|nr:hypothetical protein [Oscillospiraceae bacterium]